MLYSTLSQKPTFREIEEEPQSKLQQQREVNGEAIAIEMDGVDDPMDLTQGERNYELSQPLALGVIIPSELKDSCLPEYKRLVLESLSVDEQLSTLLLMKPDIMATF